MRHSDKTLKRRWVIQTLALVIAMQSFTPLIATAVNLTGVTFELNGVAFASASSKSAAAGQARSMYGGKVLSVEEIGEGAEKVYRVKLLLDGGRIKIVTISANNG